MLPPNDTHPDAARVQFQLLREAGTAHRLRLTFGLTQEALNLSTEALQRRRPDLSGDDRLLYTVSLRYGDVLAEAVRADLDRRRL
ncbi:MAG: hypothetical protein AAGI91_07685 [Bacteroidota bacterium]